MTKRFTFGKTERLKSRKQIEQLFSEGESFFVPPYKLFFIHASLTTHHSPLTFGIGVSNKNFRRAIDKNRIKRLTREAWRLQKNSLQERLRDKNVQLNVFFIYTGKELPDFDLVKEKVGVVLKKLENITDENFSSPA